MVRASGIDYSLVLRARPDHLFIEPLDLRAFGRDFWSRPRVRSARGHFLAVPERNFQVCSEREREREREMYKWKHSPYLSSYVDPTFHYFMVPSFQWLSTFAFWMVMCSK
jgi:hypothetical protein